MNPIQVNVILNLFSLAVVALILGGLFFDPDKRVRQTKIFFFLCCVIAVALVFDIISICLNGNEKLTIFSYIINLMDFLFSLLASLMALLLTNSFIEPISKLRKRITLIIKIIYFLFAVFCVVGTFFGWIFTINNGEFVRGKYILLFYMFPFLTILYCCISSIITEKLRTMEKLSFLLLLLFVFFGEIFQLIYPKISFGFTSSALAVLAIYIGIFVQRSRRLAEVENELSRKRMSVMISQMQPHFLFNSLTTIMDLCDRDPKMAKQAISDFSDYLRGNLDAMSSESLIPFEQELEHCKTYLGFEQLRFDDALRIVYDIHYTDFSVPPLSVQPLLENAVKHGVGHKKGGGMVMLTVEEEPSEIIIRIMDDGVGFDMSAPPDPKRSHVGIENVRSRLAQMCSGRLRISSNPGTGTTAVIRLPKEAQR
ncbi:MAG: histidine kinase [Clostridia bacterium]|nr:histidine kinase [Clostridia bacterium]